MHRMRNIKTLEYINGKCNPIFAPQVEDLTTYALYVYTIYKMEYTYIEFFSTVKVTLYTLDGLHIFKLLELSCKYI